MWDKDAMRAAINEVIEHGRPCNNASSTYGIPEPTLRRYVAKIRNNKEVPQHGGRFSTTFDSKQTEALVKYITLIDKRGFGLTTMQLRKLAFDFAEEHKIEHRFNRNRKLAGKDWLTNFIKENKISLRTAEATSVARLMSFNKPSVQKFFDILRDVLEKYKFSPDRIYNADESGLSSVPCKLPKVLSPTGTRRVAKAVSAERGKNTTVVCAVNAVGNYVPPYFIFGRVRMKEELLFGAPPGSDGTGQKNGWMCTETFINYLKHFSKYVNPSLENPVLLLVDNHSSHVSLAAINYCRERGIVMVGFPPHTTHRLQPLDVAFFGPLKTYFAQECDTHLVNHPGQLIVDRHICQLFGKAYLRAATTVNAISGFRKCGIQPFDPFIFDENEFIAAETTERAPHTERPNSEVVSDDDDDIPLIEFVKENAEITSVEQFGPDISVVQNTEQTPTVLRQEKAMQVKKNVFQTPCNQNEPRPGPSRIREDPVAAIPGTSMREDQNEDLLQKIRPFPKAERGQKTKRKKITASIITSTPVKKELEEKENLQRQKEENRKKKQEKNFQNGTSKKGKQPLLKSDITPLAHVNQTTEEISCPGCSEVYEDPPVEDWICCIKCQHWWHEECSNYSGLNYFVCDLC